MTQEDLDLEKAIERALEDFAKQDQERRKEQDGGWQRGQWLLEVSSHSGAQAEF